MQSIGNGGDGRGQREDRRRVLDVLNEDKDLDLYRIARIDRAIDIGILGPPPSRGRQPIDQSHRLIDQIDDDPITTATRQRANSPVPEYVRREHSELRNLVAVPG